MAEYELNKAFEKGFSQFEQYKGKNIDCMPDLIKDARIPISVAGVMQRRLAIVDDPEVKDAWWNNSVDTGDGIAYHSDGRAKIVHDAQPLRALTPESMLSLSALVLDNSVYEIFDGPEFSREDLGKYAIEICLSAQKAKDNPIWLALARGDKTLLNNYVDAVFDKAQEQFSRDKNMPVYVSDPQDKPVMRLWCLRSLGYDSFADGDVSLDYDFGRLVGVAPEARTASEQPVQRTTAEDKALQAVRLKKAFEFNGVVYAPLADKRVKIE